MKDVAFGGDTELVGQRHGPGIIMENGLVRFGRHLTVFALIPLAPNSNIPKEPSRGIVGSITFLAWVRGDLG
jgi:hypothetical protein